MKNLPKFDASTAGGCFLIHGFTASGKTASSITMESPILHINKEPKSPVSIHAQLPQPSDLDITYVESEGFDDIMSFLNDLVSQAEAGKCRYKSIFHDGLTFSNAQYSQAVDDDRYEARKVSKNDLPRPGMTDRFRKERPDWSTVASMMSRETFLLNQLSKFGLVVVSTAITAEYPKYNQSVRLAPSLIGQEFPKLIHGYFDYIGYIAQPFQYVDGKKPRLPRVSFVSPGSETEGYSYMARCSCVRLAQAEANGDFAPLDWSKIMKVIRKSN
jgi:hypothetical protein